MYSIKIGFSVGPNKQFMLKRVNSVEDSWDILDFWLNEIFNWI